MDTILNNSDNNNNETNTNPNVDDTGDLDKINQLETCKLLYREYQKCIDSEWDTDQCVKYRHGVKKCLELS